MVGQDSDQILAAKDEGDRAPPAEPHGDILPSVDRFLVVVDEVSLGRVKRKEPEIVVRQHTEGMLEARPGAGTEAKIIVSDKDERLLRILDEPHCGAPPILPVPKGMFGDWCVPPNRPQPLTGWLPSIGFSEDVNLFPESTGPERC